MGSAVNLWCYLASNFLSADLIMKAVNFQTSGRLNSTGFDRAANLNLQLSQPARLKFMLSNAHKPKTEAPYKPSASTSTGSSLDEVSKNVRRNDKRKYRELRVISRLCYPNVPWRPSRGSSQQRSPPRSH